MADTSDVENALVALALLAVYPNGTSSPSIADVAVRVDRGWPVSAQLDATMTAGEAIISIFPPPGLERNTTRYPRQESRVSDPVHTLSATVAGSTITIGGTLSVPQNVIALCGSRFAFAYGVVAGDDHASIALKLAAQIAAQFPGTEANGNVISVAGNPGLLRARIASTAQVAIEQSLQEKTYWITCWCPTPDMRDILAPAIDVALKQFDFIVVGTEQSRARIRYARSNTSDEGQKVQIYRRDLVYTVEYGTFTISNAYETGAVGAAVNSNQLYDSAAIAGGSGGELDFTDPDDIVLDTSL